MFNRNLKIKKYANSKLVDELTADIGNKSTKSHTGGIYKSITCIKNLLTDTNEDTYTITPLSLQLRN